MKSIIKNLKTVFILFTIICITFYLSKNWIQFALVQGNSMLPNYHNLQLVLVDKHTTSFNYHDVILFSNDTLHTTMIKRILALPGDTIQIKDGIVYVNGQKSPFISENTILSYAGIASTPIQLAADEYFVLGDNYEQSKDSRYPEIGCVKKDMILGKLFFN